MNKKRLIIVLSVGVLILMGTMSYALQNKYNPNNVKTNIDNDKKIIAKSMTDLEHENKKSDKQYKESDVKAEQIYKLYYIDEKKIEENNELNNELTLDSLLIDNDLDYSVFTSDNESASIAVVYGKDKNGSKQAVHFSTSEAPRIKKIYDLFLKGKNISDVKVIVHPSHDANKLFYITENGEKYIVPSIVDKKESVVGLKSGVKYTEKEILDNIKVFLKNNKGID